MDAPRKPLWRRLWPASIAGQLAVLVVLAILAIHAILTASFMIADRSGGPPGEATGRLAAIIEILDRAAPDERPALAAAMSAALPQFKLGLASASATLHEDYRTEPEARHLGRALGPRFTVNTLHPDDPPGTPPGLPMVVVRLADRSFVIATLPRSPGPRGGALIATLVFLAICAVLLGAWAVIALTKPLRGIAAAVEAYGPGENAPPLPETGPLEIRTVARAFNAMRQRIAGLIDDRTRALAAVSHDLRTPITRLRLRADYVEDATERARMIADLDQMDALVQGALAHLRDGRSEETLSVVDLQSLAQTVADHFADMGHDLPVDAVGRPAVRARPLEIERALTNLVDNACKYGAAARIAIRSEGKDALVEVIDRGPGIAPERRAEALQPFVRGEAARTMNDRDGFGLGLTIARAAAEAHGGSLELADGEAGTFVARLRLPLA